MVEARQPYLSADGVESAIKDAARKLATADPSLDTSRRIQVEYFNRFLSRVFSEGENSEWVLKGGTGLLARVPSTRATGDVDLYRQGFTLADSLADLIRLSAVDLGDHFQFEYAGHSDSIGNETQPYTEGYQVRFDIFIGLDARGSLQVDLAVGAGITGTVTATAPATSLDLPRLISHRYRLYPVVDQIADKVCATMTEYKGRPSSREKDLVDLVVLATTQDIDGTGLAIAILTEARRRQMEPLDRFRIPTSWGPGYTKLSRPVPHCARHRTIDLAGALVTHLIDPALSGEAEGKTWSHESLAWKRK